VKVVISVTAKEIRDMNSKDILNEITSLKRELFDLRFQQATGQLTNPNRISNLKRTIARMKTILNERVEQ
jgi:large subunit ribosomal protein L29